MATNKNRGTYRARGININTEKAEFTAALENELKYNEKGRYLFDVRLAPDCIYPRYQIATFRVISSASKAPLFLTQEDPSIDLHGEKVWIDAEFYGLTQLYPVPPDKVKLDIVALSGLNSHAYGSWIHPEKSGGGAAPMWLQDFLGQDDQLQYCRTMVFGYNTKYTARAQYWIEDYIQLFLTDLDKARSREEVLFTPNASILGREQNRPLVLIGHSIGGTIITHAYVKAFKTERYKNIYNSITRIFFFGVPFSGIDLDDVRSMLEDNEEFSNQCDGIAKQGRKLLDYIDYETQKLTETTRTFIEKVIENEIYIYSFYETHMTQKVIKLEGGGYARRGEDILVVRQSSAELRIRFFEETIPAEANHSTIVKFKDPHNGTYTTICHRLREVIQKPKSRGGGRRKHVINLPIADGAEFGSAQDQYEPECLEGTRVDLLNHVNQWVDDPNGKCIFWMYGMAGTGKSTISRTVARSLQINRKLGASFFFKRGEADRSSGTRFFTTLAFQLAHYSDGLGSLIAKAIDADPRISTKNFAEQFEKLIAEPLSGYGSECMSSAPEVVVLLIDALDECESKNDIERIVNLLAHLADIKSVKARVFFTSRPELTIRPLFGALPSEKHDDLILHEVPKIEQDISTFLSHELKKIAGNKEYSLHQDWPGAERIQILVDMATPLFIYAATLCRFITSNSKHPEQQIQALVDGSLKDGPEGYVSSESEDQISPSEQQAWKLQKTYLPILERLIDADATGYEIETTTKDFKEIVGTIINLASPLSVPNLGRLLLTEERDIGFMLRKLHSVLDVPKDRHTPVRTFHLSFHDFLSNPQLKGKNKFWVDKKEAHERITSRCIEIMNEGLKEDICNLKSPGTLQSDVPKHIIDQKLSPELQYACRYWIYHLERSGVDSNYQDKIYGFLKQHLLHWLEAASLLGDMVTMIDRINILMGMHIVDERTLSDFLYDAKRFILQSFYIIEKAPLQLYYAAVTFAPRNSLVRNTFGFKKTAQGLWQLEHDDNVWGALLLTMGEHEHKPTSVLFLPNGNTVVSAGLDGKIKFWDSGTGKLLQTISCGLGITREGSRTTVEGISSIAVSPDGAILASGLWGNIELWSIETGRRVWKLKANSEDVLKAESGDVLALAFSACSALLASVGTNGIKLWDINAGKLWWEFMDWSRDLEDAVFSPADDKALALVHSGGSIDLHDVGTGALLRMFRHAGEVAAVAFSPDGRLLASAGYGRVLLRGMDTVKVELEPGVDTKDITALAFSPNGRTLASAYREGGIILWGIDTGEVLQRLRSHSGSVGAVVFSPDGKILASASDDRTVKLWDVGVSLQGPRQDLSKNKGCVGKMAISGATLALFVRESPKIWTVRLWDPYKMALVRELRVQYDVLRELEFSPGGGTLAALLGLDKIVLWDLRTGQAEPSLQLRGSGNVINSIKFSPDGRFLASVFSDKTIRLWDVGSEPACESETKGREPLWVLRAHTSWVTCLAFSPDGKTLASGANDGTVRLWDLQQQQQQSGRPPQVLKGHDIDVSAVEFSLDGKILASVDKNKVIMLCDMDTGTLLLTPRKQDMNIHMSLLRDRVYINIGGYSFTLNRGARILEQLRQYSTTPFFDGEWLTGTRGTKRLIWLPSQVRPSSYAVSDDLICFGSDSGNILCIRPQFLYELSAL
ncbi:hypothetical protein TWF730_002675 [Orbilia blumenaviensis]|uniref:Mitochondrial division protein 1 n=1 Tax=Orbilia blumenaviensis TaxID=1796055 RepID=A0AAV9U7M3_9PEZI